MHAAHTFDPTLVYPTLLYAILPYPNPTGLWVNREVLEYVANTLIFVLSGVIISNRVHTSSVGESADVKALDYAYALLLWVYLLVRLPPPPSLPYPMPPCGSARPPAPHARQRPCRGPWARTTQSVMSVIVTLWNP